MIRNRKGFHQKHSYFKFINKEGRRSVMDIKLIPLDEI